MCRDMASSLSHCHHLGGTRAYALGALDTIGMEIAFLLTTGVIGGELHGAHLGASLALHATGLGHPYIGETFLISLWCHTCRQSAHGTEGAPCARSIDEAKHNANDGGDQNDVPEGAAYACHGEAVNVHLHTKHTKDEAEHEDAEAPGAHKLGYALVGRESRHHLVVKAASRTEVPTPIASLPDGHSHRADHANQGNNTHFGHKPCHNEINEQNPIHNKFSC